MEELKNTLYSTHGGEKLIPFESANINRSKSTYERSERFGNNQVPRADSDSKESRDSRPLQRQTEAWPVSWSDSDTDSVSSDDTTAVRGKGALSHSTAKRGVRIKEYGFSQQYHKLVPSATRKTSNPQIIQRTNFSMKHLRRGKVYTNIGSHLWSLEILP